MTQPLSALVTNLEGLAFPLPALRKSRQLLLEQLADYDRAIEEGEHAARVLAHLHQALEAAQASPVLPEPQQSIPAPEQSAALEQAGVDAVHVAFDLPAPKPVVTMDAAEVATHVSPAEAAQLVELGLELERQALDLEASMASSTGPEPAADEDHGQPQVAAQVEDQTEVPAAAHDAPQEAPESAAPAEEEAQDAYYGAPERLRDWWRHNAQQGREYTGREVAAASGVTLSSVKTLLPNLVKLGEIRCTRAGERGNPNPALYALPADEAAAPEPEAPAESIPLSLGARVLAQLGSDPSIWYTPAQLAATLQLSADAVRETLDQLVRNNVVTRRGAGNRSGVYTFRHGADDTPIPPDVQDAPTVALTEPPRLPSDQRQVWSQLSKARDGLTRGHLMSRCNWTGSMTDKVLGAMEREGLVGRNGAKFVLMAAMQEAAS